MNEPPRVSFLLVIGAMLVILFIVFDIQAQQDHTCQGGHNCKDGEVVETVVAGKRSVGVGLSGGDMDINDCLATHVLFFGIWQGTHVNAMCEAARMDRDGDYQAAAEMRCSTKKYQKVYGEGCINAVIRSAPKKPDLMKVLVGQVPDDRYEELLERLDKQDEERQQANQSYARQQQIQQQQYEEIKQIETARKRKIELIREEFGSEQATETDR